MKFRILWYLWLLFTLSGCGGSADRTISRDNVVLEAWQIINRDYVDATFNGQDWPEVRTQYLARRAVTNDEIYATARAMVGLLQDPYTRFLSPQDYQNLQTQATGALTGIGIQELALTADTQELLVVAPIPSAPAYRAGIRPRDVIATIDGTPTRGLDLNRAAQKLRGAPGTRVTLGIRRGAERFGATITRANVTTDPVQATLNTTGGHRTGYLRIAAFNRATPSGVQKAIRDLEGQGIGGYVLDLRLNPGGVAEAGEQVARLWLDAGADIVTLVTRQGRKTVSAAPGPLTRKPLVLLVDGGTASASEILAGALQDHKRAPLVGTQTFGKGLIQRVYPLSDGSALVLSIARYQTPSGRDIQKIGITPDVVIPLPPTLGAEALGTARDPQFSAALSTLWAPERLGRSQSTRRP
ncbi:S41 family peptidase [Anthocerotibacter panamensis]|uniref:S41 family peptidase n=1 Tax=Anthocerotibacter panamensis TaxID=2857077 RepID=UPI001C404122|nr:S41 family peptidase [Anthocerotibacter panamensis]